MSETSIEALVDGGSANAGPPLGPALGPLGVNIGDVVAAINEKTADFKGMQVPVTVIIDGSTKEFTIKVGSPPVSALIKKELGVQKGSGKQKENILADIPLEFAMKIANMKIDSLLAYEVKNATKEVLGTCQTLGMTCEGKPIKEVQKEISAGVYDDIFSGKEKREVNLDAAKEQAKQSESASAKAKAEATEAKAEEAKSKAEEEVREKEQSSGGDKSTEAKAGAKKK